MKKLAISLAEIFQQAAFLLFLLGSSITHRFNGVELSLWIMTFGMVLSVSTTLFPYLGLRWLSFKPMGSRLGYRLALSMQVSSWLTYTLAMYFRLNRDLPAFHRWITFTTLLWAIWLLIFIYSRHVCRADN